MVRLKALVTVILITLTLAACQDAIPVPSRMPTNLQMALPKHARLYVIGDSWSAGFGADPSRTAPLVAAAALGWTAEVNAVAGTGYARVFSPGTQTFEQRVTAMPDGQSADVVLLQGSTNDEGLPPARVAAAVRRTLNVVDKRFGTALIIMLGPGISSHPDSDQVSILDRTLARAAKRRDITYISMLQEQWITRSNSAIIIDPATLHPTVEGDAYLGGRLAADLRTLTAEP